MTYHCPQCQREIPQYIASWSNENYGNFYCPDCCINRPTIAERGNKRMAAKRLHKLDEYPELQAAVKWANEVRWGK